jgi:hypothetical protein
VNDPKRLLEEESTELERSLLRAVGGEGPSEEHRARVRQAMGIGAAPVPASAATTARSWIGKSAAVGLVVAGGVAALLLFGRGRTSAPSSPRPLPQQEATALAPTEQAPVEPPAATAPAPTEAPATTPDPGALPRAARRAAASSSSPSGATDIREQIRLIDEARSALSGHDPASALRSLDQYRSKFPGGAFDQEAAVLRIEAIDQEGDHAQAASMARAFLARNPSSAHAKRLERIAGQ